MVKVFLKCDIVFAVDFAEREADDEAVMLVSTRKQLLDWQTNLAGAAGKMLKRMRNFWVTLSTTMFKASS